MMPLPRLDPSITVLMADDDPDDILFDLDMPRIDGLKALTEIKSDPALRHTPVVVLTASSAEEDIATACQTGCNSFIQKPGSFRGLVEIASTPGQCWFSAVNLPECNER